MDPYFQKHLKSNSLNYKNSLDRIIDKYSKLQYQDGCIEVDLNNTDIRTIQHYMDLSKVKLNKLESQSVTDLSGESLRVQDITSDSQLDSTYQDGGTNDTAVSTSQLSVEDDGMSTTQLTVSSLDERQSTFCSTELQPEDHDEELEMSLRSHGKALVELYPDMINRIGRAWHRRHVTEAAESVVRRYRRWRQQPNRSHIDTTFVVPMRRSNPEEKLSKTQFKEMTKSPVKIQFSGTDATPPLQMLTSPLDWKAQQQSPGRVRGLARSEQHQPILVMDLSGSFEASKHKDISLNETFNISQQEEQSSSYAVSLIRPSHPTPKMSFRHKRLSLAAHSPQTDRCSTHALQTTVAERPDIHCSPLRQSPLKTRMMSSLSRSPHPFSRSPRAHSVEPFSQEPSKPKSRSTFLSPPRKPSVPHRMLYAQDSHHSFQSQLPSPQSAKAAAGHHRLRRHLSFDSALPLARVSDSPKKLDEDFIKLYHKFVCQSKSSFFNGLPCRYCLTRSSEASRGHSSSALAALALSPHRSLLRKRHRELSWDSRPQSKRPRDDHCKSSPGSKRHSNEMQRHHLSLSECENDGLSYNSPNKRSMFQRWITQQRSNANKHQDTWMSQGSDMSGFQMSALENSDELG